MGQSIQADFDAEKHTLTIPLADTLPGTLEVEAETVAPEAIAAEEIARRSALLPAEDKLGKLLVAGCGLGVTDESAYGYDNRYVYRFFPGGLVEEATVTEEGSGNVVRVNFGKNSKEPVVLLPSGGKEKRVSFLGLEEKY